jgi:hypothetical protein
MSRRLAISCAVICASLISPRQARAGLADIIWEMSGPQMIGAMVRCRVPLGGDATVCDVAAVKSGLDATGGPRFWLSFEAGAFVSTGRNSDGIDYKFGRIGMLAVEPMLEFVGTGNLAAAYQKGARAGAVYFGVGPLINHFIVKGPTPSFTKTGIKFRPIAIAFSGWALEYNVRLYPDGFTSDEFGFGARRDIDRPFEAVQTISISVPWLQWKIWK